MIWVQQIFGLLILICWYYLFFTLEHYNTFSVPIQREADFQTWVSWGDIFRHYRIILGVFIKCAMTITLLLISSTLPSLGILFETIEKA